MGKNWAIVIGINHYDSLQPLKYAQRDAEAMQAWFEQQAKFDQVYLFTENSPDIPTNPPISTKPTYGRLRRFFRAQFEKPLLQPGDNLWFFFAGHGKRYGERDYIMLSDSDPGDVENSALSVSWITQRLRRCGADNIVMFLDACRDIGARGEGIGTEQQQGVITFYGCSPNQQSYEIEQLCHGSFTYALLESLQIQGEDNCATVERLYQRLRYRVRQINQQHRQPLQTPYSVIEPATKLHLILLPDYATLADIAQLKLDAYQAEVEGNGELARQLWIRVNVAARGSDVQAVEAFSRIAQRQSSGTQPNSSSPISSTGTRGAVNQREEEQQQNLAQYQQSFFQVIEVEFPLSETSRKKLRDLQQFLQLKDEEVSQIEQPIVATKQAEYRQRQEEEIIRQQQEAERLRRQGQEEEIIRQQQEAERLRQQQQEAKRLRQQQGAKSGKLFEFEVVTIEKIVQSPKLLGLFSTSPTPKVVLNKQRSQARYVTENLGNGVTLDMVYIPGDRFMMGTEDEEIERLVKKFDNDWYRKEKPQHQVTIQAFYMGKYQITQAQWKAVAALPKVNHDLKPDPSIFKGDKLPVEKVSWHDAVEFCDRLSKHTGKQYQLPSEAQWEYACRAGTITPFHFGETITDKLANYRAIITFADEPKGECRGTTTPVGQFPPNDFGLYDMHGNVWEWCADYWHKNYEGAPTDGSAWIESGDNSYRVLRGGSWNFDPDYCRSAYRFRLYPGSDDALIGLRVVCVVAPRTLQ